MKRSVPVINKKHDSPAWKCLNFIECPVQTSAIAIWHTRLIVLATKLNIHHLDVHFTPYFSHSTYSVLCLAHTKRTSNRIAMCQKKLHMSNCRAHSNSFKFLQIPSNNNNNKQYRASLGETNMFNVSETLSQMKSLHWFPTVCHSNRTRLLNLLSLERLVSVVIGTVYKKYGSHKVITVPPYLHNILQFAYINHSDTLCQLSIEVIFKIESIKKRKINESVDIVICTCISLIANKNFLNKKLIINQLWHNVPIEFDWMTQPTNPMNIAINSKNNNNPTEYWKHIPIQTEVCVLDFRYTLRQLENFQVNCSHFWEHLIFYGLNNWRRLRNWISRTKKKTETKNRNEKRWFRVRWAMCESFSVWIDTSLTWECFLTNFRDALHSKTQFNRHIWNRINTQPHGSKLCELVYPLCGKFFRNRKERETPFTY